MPIAIDYGRCCWKDGACASCRCGGGAACKGCVEACPTGALTRGRKVEFDSSKCIGCGQCADACAHGAITPE